MKSKSILLKQILAITMVVIVFFVINFYIYMFVTNRLANNFSDTSQAKMVDVKKYLPHKKDSDLVRIDSSLKLSDNLPEVIHLKHYKITVLIFRFFVFLPQR